MSEFDIKVWDGTEDVLEQYAALLSFVYKRDISAAHIQWKHSLNPVGKSLITYAQSEQGEMVAARALWPMYSSSSPVYQPCDTVTRADFQRRGLFSKLTLKCLELIEDDAMVVNFPNNNSYPAYLKLGWELFAENKKVFSLGLPIGRKIIDNLESYLEGKVSPDRKAYLCWRFSQKSGNHYVCREHKEGFLVENGSQSGFVSFGTQSVPFETSIGLQQGYTLPGKPSLPRALFRGALTLNCSSRTAYLCREGANMNTLNALFETAQLNTLMDTF